MVKKEEKDKQWSTKQCRVNLTTSDYLFETLLTPNKLIEIEIQYAG